MMDWRQLPIFTAQSFDIGPTDSRCLDELLYGNAGSQTDGVLAYLVEGGKRKLVRILRRTDTGAVAQYEPVDKPGDIYMPLLVDGQNVDKFEICEIPLNQGCKR